MVEKLLSGNWQDLNLNQKLIDNCLLYKKTQPSEIQFKTIPFILQGQDVIAQAKSGTGKTLAFVLGTLGMVQPEVKAIQCICLCHTRELAQQTCTIFEQMSKDMGIEIMQLKNEQAKYGQILIATTGILDRCLKRGMEVSQVKLIIIDEADYMFDIDLLGEQTTRIISKMPKSVQTLLFSATYNPRIIEFVINNMKNPQKIQIQDKDLTLDEIQQVTIRVNKDQKLNLLDEIYKKIQITQTIIFINTVKYAQRVVDFLTRKGHQVGLITGQSSPEDREQIFTKFKIGEVKVLITTNLLSRGIDISLVSLVINFDIPYQFQNKQEPDYETYLHRIGRTGRFGKYGLALNLVTSQDQLNMLEKIKQRYNCQIKEVQFEEILDNLEILVKKNTELMSNY